MSSSGARPPLVHRPPVRRQHGNPSRPSPAALAPSAPLASPASPAPPAAPRGHPGGGGRRGVRRPSAEILQQIAKGLRISAEALYVQAGILEDRAPDSGVRAAVLAEPGLTERQKQVLLEIFDSFRKETAARAAATGGALADAAPDEGTERTGGRLGGSGGHGRARGLVVEDDDDDPLAGEGPQASGDDSFPGRARSTET